MFCVVHGDDIVSTRKKLNELTQDAHWVIRLDGEKDSISQITGEIKARELFTDKKTIIFEHFFDLEKKNLDLLISALSSLEKSKEVDVLVWEEKEVSKNYLQKFKNAKVFLLKLPKYYFSFLDTTTPVSGKKIHELLYKVYPGISDEQIFYSLIKRIRLLMIIKTGEYQEFSDAKNLASWQVSKMHAQADLWSESQLLKFHKKLFELEVGLKTSNLPLPLIHHLDILLLRELN